jgi:hypothetical protein
MTWRKDETVCTSFKTMKPVETCIKSYRVSFICPYPIRCLVLKWYEQSIWNREIKLCAMEHCFIHQLKHLLVTCHSLKKETLIKSITQAVPTYSMSCFLLSPDACKKITSATSNYWWSGVAYKRSIHWRKSTDLTLPKCHGGLRFWDIKNFNLAMLGKQGWRLMSVDGEFWCSKDTCYTLVWASLWN